MTKPVLFAASLFLLAATASSARASCNQGPISESEREAAGLLPRTPEGWRYEKIDFPLGFAPDIELEGYEELRFAPGMFTPGSDTYFSYVLALALEGDVDVDEAFLEDFLYRYYHGLCGAVARGKTYDVEVDLEAIRVDVRPTLGGHVARIDMFDAFTNGAPLSLRVDILSHPLPGATQVLGLATPHPEDSAVARSLRAMGEEWRSSRPVPALLHHVYFVPDRSTFDAIQGHDFLRREFAVFEERRTVRADMSYAGQYLYGERTYFEFLDPASTERFAVGDSGVAFGFEVPGGAQRIAATLEEKGLTVFQGPRTRELEGEPVPWFQILGIQQPTTDTRLSLFGLEYASEFLDAWHPDPEVPLKSIERRAVNARYASVLEQKGEERLLRDVVAVHLALPEAELAWLDRVAVAFGYRRLEGGTRGWQGPQFRLVTTPGAETGRVTALEFELRRSVEPRDIEIGSTTLRLEGRTGLWLLQGP